MNRRSILSAIATGILLLHTSFAMADDYPSRPIKIIVPNAAGGGTDITTRLVADAFAKKLGARVAVVNIGGGGTSIGAMQAARAEPDGYTILSVHDALFTSTAMGLNKIGPNGLVPIAQVTKEIQVLAVAKGSAIGSLKIFYDRAKKGHAGDKLKLGVNPGAINHFATLKVLSLVDHDVVFVPTGGGAKTLRSLLGGHIDAAAFGISEAIEAIRSGDIVPLTVLNDQRFPDLPDLPTAIEQGFNVTQANLVIWYAPKGTPQDRVDILASALTATIQDPAFQKVLLAQSLVPDLLTGPKLAESVKERLASMQELANKYVIGK